MTIDVSSGARPFSLPNRAGGYLARRLAAPALGAAEAVLGLAQLNRLYGVWLAGDERDADGFCDRALEILEIGYDVGGEDLARVPTDGGLIVVANHPHGALDGLVLASALRRVRRDVRLLGNSLLAQIPELRRLCVFVSPFDADRGSAANAAGLREAFEWVRDGGALVVFPAGEVSHATSARGPVADAPWHAGVMRLAERTAAPLLPIFVEGTNSRLFQLAGLVHPVLRTILLPRELLRQRRRRVRIRVGAPVAWPRLEAVRTTDGRLAYLRLRTYALEGALQPRSEAAATSPGPRARTTIPPVAPERLLADLAGLDPSRLLVRSGDHHVYCARAAEMPHVLREIGRLREVTFRAAGEGTGREIDLDRFDARYWHLFAWNAARGEIAGAYRIGVSRANGRAATPRVLYTRTLFRYGRRFLAELGPALELGRSFVRQEYQRDYGTLMLLWKGIGHFVARHPEYRILFGPVSISADYSAASRELLVSALSGPRFASSFARLVRPKRALELRQQERAEAATALTPDVLDEFLRDAEPDGKGLPVLLRQYLRLGGRLAAFSVDPAFGHVVDGLMVVDLAQVALPVLQRHMGREGAARFLACHRGAAEPAADRRPAVASA